LKKPNTEPLNLLGAYKGKKLVGFLGTFAVNFRYNDIEMNGVSGSFCTIHVDYKKMGMAKALIREATRLGIREGLDISCSVLDEGHPMEKSSKMLVRNLMSAILNFNDLLSCRNH